jgi:hypothetical protein
MVQLVETTVGLGFRGCIDTLSDSAYESSNKLH